jgi:hypothetical protein
MGKDVQELPARNKLVMGVTSVWMLLPMAHAVVGWSEGVITRGQAYVVAALTCACVASVVFWSDARGGSRMHAVDRGCAVLNVACVGLLSVCGGGERVVCAELQALLATAMLGLFTAGDVCFRRSRYEHQLAFHVMFHYVTYWWGHVLLVRAERHFAVVCVCVSVGYFDHITGVCSWDRGKTAAQLRYAYWGSCAALLVWVVSCGRSADVLH